MHEILYNKCLKYGIQGRCLEWIKSFLSDRMQCTEVCNFDEEGKEIKKTIQQQEIKVWSPSRVHPGTYFVSNLY